VKHLPLPVCPGCGCPESESEWGCWCQPATRAALDGIRAAAYYEGPLRNAILRLKFKNDIGLAAALGPMLEACWHEHGLRADLLVPVPLAPARQRERGYNQAALLAGALGERIAIGVASGALARTRDTGSQIGLRFGDRYANVAGAFRANGGSVAGRTVALVDDVCTSGATLAACAAALREAGAAEVWGVALARPRREPRSLEKPIGGDHDR
jgi:ComF family protein